MCDKPTLQTFDVKVLLSSFMRRDGSSQENSSSSRVESKGYKTRVESSQFESSHVYKHCMNFTDETQECHAQNTAIQMQKSNFVLENIV